MKTVRVDLNRKEVVALMAHHKREAAVFGRYGMTIMQQTSLRRAEEFERMYNHFIGDEQHVLSPS